MANASPTRRGAGAPRRRRWSRLLAVSVGSVALLDVIVRSVAIGDSDGATVILEGQTMSAGHLLLPAWSLSLDSFWSIDAIFYAIAVHFFGVRGNLIFLVPAVIAAVVILVAATMAMDRRISLAAGRARSRRSACWHCRVAPLRSTSSRVRSTSGRRFGACWPSRSLPGTASTGAGPSRWCSSRPASSATFRRWSSVRLRYLRPASPRPGAPAKVACRAPAPGRTVGSALLAYAVRIVAVALGTFSHRSGEPVRLRTPADSQRSATAELFRRPARDQRLVRSERAAGRVRGREPRPRRARTRRSARGSGGDLPAAWAARKTPTNPTRSELLSSLVCFAFIGGLITFVIFPIVSTPAYARYLNGALIFGALLGGRVITVAATGRSPKFVRSLAAGVVVIVALFAGGVAFEVRGSRPVQPATQLANFLEAHHLAHGVGAYWSAAITTVESKGVVQVRPVIEYGTRLVRYDKNSDSGWYAGVRFNYVVYDARAPWGGVSKESAIATWGPPNTVQVVGPYRVLVYARPFTVSVEGWTGTT